MIESDADRGNGPPVAPRPVLPFRAPTKRSAGERAAFAKGLSLAFIPVLAVLALVDFALAALALALPMAGLVLGLVACDRTADDRARRTARTATIWGGGQLLVMALVMIFVLPNLGRAREPAKRIGCASNLRQIGIALQIYSSAHGGLYPPSFDELLITGEIITIAFVCPSKGGHVAQGATTQQLLQSFHQPGCCTYVYALEGQRLAASAVTADYVLAYEDMTNHDHQGVNVLYGNGSAKWLAPGEAEHVIAELQAGRNPPRPLRR